MKLRQVIELQSPDINMKRIRSLVFKHEGHEYRYKGRKTKLSTTGFIKQFFPIFNPDEVIAGFRSRPGCKSERAYRHLTDDQLKKKWDDDGNIAAGKGTILHEMIELSLIMGFSPGWMWFSEVKDYCETRLANNSVNDNEPDLEMISRWYEILTHEAYDPEFDQETGWRNYLALEEALQHQGVYEPVMAEVKIHTDEQISGMVDMLYRDMTTGKFLVCDWKRSKDLTKKGFKPGYGPCKTYNDSKIDGYSLQVSFYSWALRKYYGVDVVGAWIVGLHPNKDSFQIIPVDINAHLNTIELMVAMVTTTIYMSAANFTDINLVKYTKEGMKRRTMIVEQSPSPGINSIILDHNNSYYGFDVVINYLNQTPLHSMHSEIYLPYLDGYTKRWTQDDQDIYKSGFPLNITFVFVAINE